MNYVKDSLTFGANTMTIVVVSIPDLSRIALPPDPRYYDGAWHREPRR